MKAVWDKSGGGALGDLAERFGHVLGGLKPLIRVAGEGFVEEGIPMRELGLVGAHLRRVFAQDGHHATELIGRAERVLAAEHLEQDHAGGPQIGACIDGLGVFDLLGAHVARRSEQRAGSGL